MNKPEFIFDIGDRVVVEVTGTIKVKQETEYGLKYIVQPDNPRAEAVHTSPEYVFPEDDSGEPVEVAVGEMSEEGDEMGEGAIAA